MKTSKTKSLFELVISYWPDSVLVKDKILFDNGGARIPELIRIHDEIEAKILSGEDDYLLRQMDWAIFTVLHSMAKTTDELIISQLDFKAVEDVYLDNIKDD